MTSGAGACLVLIESQGNQQYVFSTNRLRLMIGGSEQLYRVGTWVLEHVLGRDPSRDADAFHRAQVLLDWKQNTPVIGGSDYEVVLATSSKAVVLARDRELARALIRSVTSRALVEAPMMDVCGVAVALDSGTTFLADAYDAAVVRLAHVRQQLPPASGRFPLVPIVERCRESALPVSAVSSIGGKQQRVSEDVLRRTSAADSAWERIGKLAATHKAPIVRSLDDLETGLAASSWMAIVHADGNGVGGVFSGLGGRFGQQANGVAEGANREYVDFLRRFSLGLEILLEDAFFDAVATTAGGVPVAPFILGGDDATFACDASISLALTTCFIQNFRSYSANPSRSLRLSGDDDVARSLRDAVSEGATEAGVETCFGMAAGIAATKAHHPFFGGYRLAEELLRSAKMAKRAGMSSGSIDFHVLFDSVSESLDTIRGDRTTGGHRLFGGPYLLDAVEPAGSDSSNDSTVIKFTKLADIVGADDVLRPANTNETDAEAEGRQLNALLHRLRTAVTSSLPEARIVLHTYEKAGHLKHHSGEMLNTIKSLIPASDNASSPVLLLDVLDLQVLRRPASSDTAGPEQESGGAG